MRLAADLAEPTGGEIAEIVGEGDANAEGQGHGTCRMAVALDLREEAAGDELRARRPFRSSGPRTRSSLPVGSWVSLLGV